MSGPLWTARHAPALTDLPQPEVRRSMERALAEPMNLVVHGPTGAGKTAAVRAFTREAHENPDADRTEINVADFFDLTKSEIREDPRFAPFLQGETEFSKRYRRGSDQRNKYKREWSKREMLGHVVTEMAGYAPSSGAFKTLVLDNAEGMREDFQQSLRRTMEQYHETTQFVIVTRRPSALIAPIRSRCFPVPVRAPTTDEIVTVLAGIAEREGVPYEETGIEFIAGAASGDLRDAILSAQTTAESAGEITRETAYETLSEVATDERVEGMLDDAEAGAFTDARSTLDDLLVDEGYSGGEVLETILSVARSRYAGEELARVHRLAGEIDMDLQEGTDDRLHLSHLLARLGDRRDS